MAIGKKLGSAHVTVVAEVQDFAGPIVAALKKSAEPVELYCKRMGRAAGGKFVDGVTAALSRSSRQLTAYVKRVGRQIGEALGDGIVAGILSKRGEVAASVKALIAGLDATINVRADVTEVTSALDGITRDGRHTAAQVEHAMGNASRNVANNLAELVPGVSEKAAKLITSLGDAFGFSGSNGYIMAASILAIEVAITGAMGAFVIFGQLITQLAGTVAIMPGAIAAIIAVVLPLKMAFAGVGDTISKALSEKDAKKYKELLDSMPKSLQRITKELKGAQGWWSSLTSGVQDALFGNLAGIIPRAIQYFGPAVKAGFTRIANALGDTFRGIIDSLFNDDVLNFLMRLFATVQRIIPQFEGPLSQLANALVAAADAALPIIERLATGFAGSIGEFADWLAEKVASGAFTGWIETGIDLLGDLGTLIWDTGRLLGIMFDEGNSEGKNFIEALDEIITDMIRFAETEDGRMALEGFVITAKALGLALYYGAAMAIFAVTALGSLAGAVRRLIRNFGELVSAAWDALQRRLSSLINWARRAVDPILHLGNAIGALMNRINSVSRGANVLSGVMSAIGGILGYADGGIVNSPEIAMIGEAGPEVVIPLSNPSRAKQLARESGLTSLLGGSGGETSVQVYIGDEQLTPKFVKVVKDTMKSTVRSARIGGLPATA